MTENEQDPKLTDEQCDAGLTIEGQLSERFEQMFNAKWNSRIRPYVDQKINEKIAEESLRLGKQFGELIVGGRGIL
jgi:hypothetical protein